MNNKGMTLIEIIIAVLVVTILAAGMFSSFVGSQYFFNRARHRMQAFNFAREVLDKLRSKYGYNETVYPEIDFETHDASEIGVSISGDLAPLIDEDGFTYEVFTYDGGSQVDGYKKIEVKVEWTEALEAL